MKKSQKDRAVLDWYGRPIPNKKVPKAQSALKGEEGRDGRYYLRPWSQDGKPGDRVPLESVQMVIHDEQGNVVYDYGCHPPPDAKIEPGYVGFLYEEILKGYFGQANWQRSKLSGTWRDHVWMETTEEGQKFWRWNVVWHDRLAVEDEDRPPSPPRRT